MCIAASGIPLETLVPVHVGYFSIGFKHFCTYRLWMRFILQSLDHFATAKIKNLLAYLYASLFGS